jgi:hypothetical protein
MMNCTVTRALVRKTIEAASSDTTETKNENFQITHLDGGLPVRANDGHDLQDLGRSGGRDPEARKNVHGNGDVG